MAAQDTTPSGYWNWDPPGKPVRIQLNLDLVDRMSNAILDGFGSVPKRGAETGGVLLGSRIRIDGKLQITLDDYVPVECSHRFGPSFILSDGDLSDFEAAVRQNAGVIGYYRSHTREGLALSAEDLQVCQKFFSSPDDVMLLVKPSAMKASMAGFFYYQNGEIQDQTDLEFPFRRSELETGEAPARRPLGERRPQQQPPPPSFDPPVGPPARPGEGGFQDPRDSFSNASAGYDPAAAQPGQPYRSSSRNPRAMEQQEPPSHSQAPYPTPALNAGRLRKNWVWFPLSFIFLLLGVLLGFQAAISFSSVKGTTQDPYSLSLGVERRQDDLAIRWDRSNQAIRTASKAVLEIQDGKYAKRVDLDSAQLQTGSVIYRFSADNVRFKLEVYPRDHIVISEWVEWKGKR